MCVLIPILGISVSKRQFPNKWFYENIKENAVKFSSFILINKHFKLMDEKLNNEKSRMQLVKIQNIVKNETIGYFGLHPGVMVYNNFNYISSPASISFISWNKSISKADRIFYQKNKKAPLYLIFDLQSIDGRLPSLDSSLSQLEIFHRYTW